MSDEQLRDKFAAAALTGLMSSLPSGDQYHPFAVERAWSLADAMLRERVRKNTSNDAGPRLRGMNDGLLIGGGMRQTDAEHRAEIERLMLTDEEREAIGEAIRLGDEWGWSETLRGLLERLGGGE
jgi:hypothetical protein